MNRKVAVVYDDGGDVLSMEGVFRVPLYVLFNGESAKSTEISNERFESLYSDPQVKLSTSKPTERDFEEVYEKVFNRGYEEIISIHISSEISGTYQTAVDVSKEFEKNGKTIHVVDSRTASTHLYIFVVKIRELLDAGFDAKAIAEKAKVFALKSFAGFFVGDLKHLVSAGRIGRGKAMLGSVFNLKPMLRSAKMEGILEPWAKPRTFKGVFQLMLDEYRKHEKKVGEICIGTGFKSSKIFEDFLSFLKENGVNVKIMRSRLSPVIEVNFGAEFLSIAFFTEEV